MAALYGKLRGQAGEATRIGSARSGIAARLETWHGAITTTLEADGSFAVRIGPKGSHGATVVTGNVNDGQRFAALEDDEATANA